MPGISKILIANRGEIAIRVARTCRELGISTVAVYSSPDRTSPHVRACDEAYEIGPAPSRESYLRQDAIIDLAVRRGVDAIHPGYGFLAENPEFVEKCDQNGIVFIGPPAFAMRAMGDKTSARRLMKAAGVPVVPGTVEPVHDLDEAGRVGSEIGYPILLKAAAGGGGKGMRTVDRAEDLAQAFASARSEATSAFGDDRVFIEKLIAQPRHVEFQILADAHGGVVHLLERECSIQRRHQKVIEEAPSPVVTDKLRATMGQAAVEAARSCGYVNAGTVEFLVDADLNFYFMEMNTRLQVEHPVTEWITGVDLVLEQIRVAAGERLGFDQSAVSGTGHAIECRIYAEDPDNDFLPDAGRLIRHRIPSGPGVRIDAGVDEGGCVEIHYDPMISKLTTWGRDRDEAIRRMDRALTEYEIAGVKTTIPFCQFAMRNEAFRRGDLSTHFIETHFSGVSGTAPAAESTQAAAVAAALVSATQSSGTSNHSAAVTRKEATNWKQRRELT